jgi:predicted esterase
MIEKWIVREPNMVDKAVGCVIALPGRGIPGVAMERFLSHTGLWRSLQIVLEPEHLQWYPQPNGPEDQKEAIAGLPKAMNFIHEAIQRIQHGWDLRQKDIALIGFSAGAVMSLMMVSDCLKEYAGVVALAGAILDPASFPKAKNKTPILLQHNMDDDCFKWEERYIPMREALTKGGYNLTCEEGWRGGHNLSYDEVRLTRDFLSKQFGYYDDFEVEEKDMEEYEED